MGPNPLWGYVSSSLLPRLTPRPPRPVHWVMATLTHEHVLVKMETSQAGSRVPLHR